MSKKTTEVAQRASEGGITPLEYLLKVMRNPKTPQAARVDAAKSAAPYMHPRLSAVSIDLKDISDDDLRDAAT